MADHDSLCSGASRFPDHEVLREANCDCDLIDRVGTKVRSRIVAQMEELLALAKVQREDQPEGDMRDAPFDYGQRMWYGGRVTGICEALLLINEEAQR
jgi:hypothetical protein